MSLFRETTVITIYFQRENYGYHTFRNNIFASGGGHFFLDQKTLEKF